MYMKVSSFDPDHNQPEDNAVSTESKEKTENNHDDQDANKSKDLVAEESQQEHIPYPKSVFFIISNEFCERFSFYGMRTILSLYLRDILLFSESDSKVIYHLFTMFAYFFPIFGAIISDSWLGKFKTILYVSIIYAAGNVLLALASAAPIGLPQVPFSLIALVLIAIGTGGIKPCVAAFGGDQFVVPQQEVQLAAFFSVFYFSINAGSLISTFLTPVLREDVQCFGENSCFPLAFAVPGILMIVSIIIFFLGMPMYKISKPEGNVVVQVCKCIWTGVKKQIKSEEKVDHWLDHSESKFGKVLVDDVKKTLKVLVIFIPLPIFYALYDQQGSGWTFQATRMKGDIGFYTILPDQMQVINPFLILLFIPLFNYGVYPLLAKFNLLKTPLQRMACGGFLTALAFGISSGISFALEATYPELPTEGNCQLRIYNPYPCNATMQIQHGSNNINAHIPAMGYEFINVDKVDGDNLFDYVISGCDDYLTYNETQQVKISEEKSLFYFMSDMGLIVGEDNIDKPEDGFPRIRTLVSNFQDDLYISYYNDENSVVLNVSTNDTSLSSLDPGTYKLEGKEVEFLLGGVYTVLVNIKNNTAGKQTADIKYYQITEPNSVHILWLVPQYVIITAGEIFFSITGYEFSYSQAPVSMKAVLQAAFLLTSAVGNLIIVIIESAKIFDKQSYDFLLYAILMVFDMILFGFMATKYRYVKNEKDNKESEQNEKNQND